MNNIIKYSALCIGAILCATSLTSCPGARAASKVGRSASHATRPATRSGSSYLRRAGDAGSLYVDYRRNQDRNNNYNNYSYGYGGGNSYGGYGY